MAETQTEQKSKNHEHSYYPTEIYSLADHWYVVVKLECSECGKVDYDVGERVDNDRP